MAVTLLVVDDHEIVHAGVTYALAGTDIQIIGHVFNGKDVLKHAIKLRPAVILLDVRMPDGDGLSCLARLRMECPNISVLMFSGFDNHTYMARAVALGASGYLLKSASLSQLKQSIRAAASGDRLWSRETLRRIGGSLAQPAHGVNMDVQLTKRESEVLKQIALGLTNKEIAKALEISYETVKEHVQHILRKLNVTDRTQAAVWAVRNNLI